MSTTSADNSEGALRELIAQGLKVHVDNEFHIFSYLGEDLPGALVATPMEPDDVPDSVLSTHGKARAVKFKKGNQQNPFSLAGVQMKQINLPTQYSIDGQIARTLKTDGRVRTAQAFLQRTTPAARRNRRSPAKR